MKLEELSVSRRGKLVVINHQKYQIEFNLSKGTWNYSDRTGKTIIKNGSTQIHLKDGTNLKTSEAGLREFQTGPLTNDAFGAHQTVKFSYETKGTSKQRQSGELDSSKHHPSPSDSADVPQNDSVNTDGAADGTGIRIHTYLTCYADHPYILLKVGVENLNPSPISLANITLIDISAQHGAVQLGSHPSQYHLFLKMPAISPSAETQRKIYDGFHLNQDNTLPPCQDGILYDTDSKKSLVFGFITSNKWWPRMQIGYQAPKRKSQQGITSWSLYHDCEQKECQSGEEVTSEIGFLEVSEDTTLSYKRYIERLATENSGQITTILPDSCSHDHKATNLPAHQTFAAWRFSLENMHGKLDAQTIEEQAESIAKSPHFKPTLAGGIDYINLERGWQVNPGNLTLNADNFPNGMKPVVEQIHAKGLKAGICIDPFAIEPNSKLLQKHPSACLRTTNQEQEATAEGDGSSDVVAETIEVHLPARETALAILDVSHPEAQKHIKKVIKQVIDEWGYDLITADFSSYTSGMMSVATNVTWHDNSLTSTELYRQAVRLLTESVNAAKKDVILAGYNLIESVSIGSFAFNYPLLCQKSACDSEAWHQQNGIKHRISRYAGYLNAHNILWKNAYGNLDVDEPRPVNEAIVEMTATALSGAAAVCANTPTAFSSHRAELIAKLFPLSGDAATAVDRYDEPFSQIWHLPVKTPRENWNLVGVFNWKDQQDDIHLNLGAFGLNPDKDYLVHDFWMRQYLGVVSKNVTLMNMAPRSAKLLCFREEQQVPQLLSTDIHYTQGSVEILSAGWDNHSQSLLLISKPPRQSDGSFFIHVPETFLPTGVSAYGSDYHYSWDKPIYRLTFGPSDTYIHASIQFTNISGGSRKS